MQRLFLDGPQPEALHFHSLRIMTGRHGEQTAGAIVPMHLDGMNSGEIGMNMSASAYEEEVVRIKAFFRARYSSIMDSLSGTRLSVKECAPPILTIVSGQFSGLEFKSGQISIGLGEKMIKGRRHSTMSTTSISSGSGSDSGNPDSKSGWQSVLSVFESYNKGRPICTPNAFLVQGSPGAGKSCFVCRLLMETLDRCQRLIPLLLPVADLVKRSEGSDSSQRADDSAIEAWFDKYLRLTFGEDSLRYCMIVQAIKMSRVVFIFEGLEDSEALSVMVEGLITRLVQARHLVVVTSRPMIPGKSSLEDMTEFIVNMKLENLNDEQKRLVAHARLGMEGIDAYDKLFARLSNSQSVGEQSEGDQTSGDGAEDVFGNPMMLSMLLCYLQTKRTAERQSADPGDKQTEFDQTTLTAIYRVAIEVMLQRVQSRQQADRHNMQEKVEQSKHILQKMAMAMQMQRRSEIRVSEVVGLLPKELHPSWEALKSAVLAGHAMFLRMSGDSGKEELRFLVKGFQNFFAASGFAHYGVAGLPDLKTLLTDSWWAQLLEMLGEAWSLTYVELIEKRLADFTPANQDSFLHIAARAGHRTIFQLLPRMNEKNRADLNKTGQDQMSPLHVAAAIGHTQVCELMLKAGAVIDAEDSSERLAVHVAMQNGQFQTASFLMERWIDQFGHAKSYNRRVHREGKAEKLAQRILEGELAEKDFIAASLATFTEIGFFSSVKANDVDRKRTMCALLAVYWITGNQYDLFVRGQSEDTKLQRSSWDKLQDWTRRTVGLTKSAKTVNAMLVYVAIMNLGKIKPFRMAFVPEEDEPTEALARILQKSPILVPSFAKLEPHMQQAILSALKADFNFGQFLQAENLPASLFTVRQILSAGGSVDILGFFLFRIFAAMCGILGMKSLEGSLFMTDKVYLNFEVGLDVLQHLMEDGAVRTYDRFLAERAKAQGLSLYGSDPESRALVRLACLTRVFDAKGGKDVSDAYYALPAEGRMKLMNFLNADGVKHTPGILLYNSPLLIENARKNSSIGLDLIYQVLISVYEAAEHEYAGSEQKVVTIIVDELAKHVLTCENAESFGFTKFDISRTPGQKGDIQGTVQMSPWQLQTDASVLQGLEDDATALLGELVPQTGLREMAFLKKVQSVFPELGYMGADDETKGILRETLGRLLVVYWTATDQADAFTRGQDVERKLSESSWKKVQVMMDTSLRSSEVLNVILVVMVIMDVARLPKFAAQLAPKAENPKQVLEHVLDNCPKVLPSFWRLPVAGRQLARECLTRDFSFAKFISAEVVPASITTIKDMLADSESTSDLSSLNFLTVFLYCVFAEMSASLGGQSLEGSLFMTDEKWAEFQVALHAIQQLEHKGEKAIYDMILANHANKMRMTFDADSADSWVLARLARLSHTEDITDSFAMVEAFKSLKPEEQASLRKYLGADGISQKPGLALHDSHNFLKNACQNAEVGPLSALMILLKVCEEVAREFKGVQEAVITVKLERLAEFAKEFAGAVTFQDLPFELLRTKHLEALMIPKVWIPVHNESALDSLQLQCRKMASDVLDGTIGERRFKTLVLRAFPELAYFGTAHAKQRSQTFGAMLSVLWLVNDQRDAFVRDQDEDDCLSKQSWEWIQEWMSDCVRLSTEEAVDATLVFMAIHALGKITQFREELAPGYPKNLHDGALAHILETQPELVPSFLRLSRKYQQLIIDSLSVDFQFSQFLQAENVPANLVVVKQKMQPHGADGFALFCFRIFAQMCGKLGDRSLEGSIFMTESQFQRIRPGLGALQQLRILEAGPAYNAFLLLQGSKALSRFASPEHQALARLLCLGSASDHTRGDALCEAFDQLLPHERVQLTRWLTADGIKQLPGYVLCDAPDLLRNAEANPAVGLSGALKALVRVQELCQMADVRASKRNTAKAYVHMNQLALWAHEAGPNPGDFLEAILEVTSEEQAESRVHVVEVHRPEGPSMSRSGEMGDPLWRCVRRTARLLTFLLLVLMFLASAAGLFGLICFPDRTTPLLRELDPLEVPPRIVKLSLLGIALFSCIGILYCSICSPRPAIWLERIFCCARSADMLKMTNNPSSRSAMICGYAPLLNEEAVTSCGVV